jgi:hypothetical protein
VRKYLPLVLIGALLGVLIGFYYYRFVMDSPEYRNYKQVQIGMSVDEVQAILGPGTAVNQSEVPGIVVAVNPGDEVASEERARRSGRPPPTIRDYPTRIKPVVEGDYILQWVNSRTGERILVAFRDGKVCEKDYWDPNYL